MKLNEDIETINKKRLELINSDEYNIGRRIIIFKKMLKKFKLIELFNEIKKHYKISKLSYSNLKQYEFIKQRNIQYEEKKIVIYTCITGNYDILKDNYFEADNVEYILFTDNQNLDTGNNKWKISNISNIKELRDMSLTEKNRYIKLHPYELFKDKYDYAIYIDGNIQVISDLRKLINGISNKYGIAMHNHRNRIDIYKEYKVCKILKKGNLNNLKKQIQYYKNDKFPKNYGMLEANVIYIDLKNEIGNSIMNTWWEEFLLRKSGRDQIALPYVLWKKKIDIHSIATLGSNVYKNPIFFINGHNKKTIIHRGMFNYK